MKALTALGLCLTMTALLAGCSSPQNAIVGKWKGNRTGVFQLTKDGNFIGGDTFSGTYTFPDATHLRLGNGSDSMTCPFKIEGDTLTLTFDTGRGSVTREPHRVKE